MIIIWINSLRVDVSATVLRVALSQYF